MPQRDDERLIAYLDGETGIAERREIEARLDRDPAARDRLAELARSANLLRLAYDEITREAVPERLIAAARGEAMAAGEAEIVRLDRRRPAAGPKPARRWRVGLPLAASLAGLLIGGGATYYGAGGLLAPGAGRQSTIAAAENNLWLDNVAGYFKLYVNAGDSLLVDVPAGGDTRQAWQKISQRLPQQIRLPNLKPWGLDFRGARLVVVEGRPAAQLAYTTANKAIGPLNLIIGSSRLPDIAPTYARRENVNLLYWRHQGRAYVLVGRSDVGYLWGIANDVAWQLDAI